MRRPRQHSSPLASISFGVSPAGLLLSHCCFLARSSSDLLLSVLLFRAPSLPLLVLPGIPCLWNTAVLLQRCVLQFPDLFWSTASSLGPRTLPIFPSAYIFCLLPLSLDCLFFQLVTHLDFSVYLTVFTDCSRPAASTVHCLPGLLLFRVIFIYAAQPAVELCPDSPWQFAFLVVYVPSLSPSSHHPDIYSAWTTTVLFTSSFSCPPTASASSDHD